jgi:ribosome biogenesis GTPase
MNQTLFERLRPIGMNTASAQALALLGAAAPESPLGAVQPMRIAEVHRDMVELHDGLERHVARLLPRVQRDLTRTDDPVAVGDWVLAGRDAHAGLWVHARMPPLTRLARRTESGARHALVNNVDTALLLMGLDRDFNPRRLERYLALVQAAGVWPAVVLTKADLCDDLGLRLEALRGRVGAQVGVHAINGGVPEAASILEPYLGPGQTVVLLGSSGAGKSTLTNTLVGRSLQATGAVRADDSRGRHTTTTRSLIPLPGGGCVIDTPGLRALAPDVDADLLSAGFADIAEHALQCRFRDCRHTDEPGCAVREAVPADRLANFHKLRRDIRRQRAEGKARGRAAHARMKMKRG